MLFVIRCSLLLFVVRCCCSLLSSSSTSGVACKCMHKGITEGHVTSLFRGTSPLVKVIPNQPRLRCDTPVPGAFHDSSTPQPSSNRLSSVRPMKWRYRFNSIACPVLILVKVILTSSCHFSRFHILGGVFLCRWQLLCCARSSISCS